MFINLLVTQWGKICSQTFLSVGENMFTNVLISGGKYVHKHSYQWGKICSQTFLSVGENMLTNILISGGKYVHKHTFLSVGENMFTNILISGGKYVHKPSYQWGKICTPRKFTRSFKRLKVV